MVPHPSVPIPRRLPAVAAAIALALACSSPLVSSAAGPRVRQRSIYDDLVTRAEAYVFAYERRLSAIVAEEHYLQQIKPIDRLPKGLGPRAAGPGPRRAPAGPGLTSRAEQALQLSDPAASRQTRRMISDFLMVQLPDRTWYGFRDVIEVDGRRVRDRDGRLRELFLRAQTTSQQIVDESARYNIGTVRRNLNLPTFALAYLHPGLHGQFTFTPLGEETLDGRPVVAFRFAEVGRPTVVKWDKGDNIASIGRIWIDKRTAEVIQTELLLEDEARTLTATITVLYRRSDELNELVPVEMRERYQYPSRPLDPIIECLATYEKFRRFTVQVEEAIKVPK